MVVYARLVKYGDQYAEEWIEAGNAPTYEGAEELRKQLVKESKERHKAMVAELKALNRGYRG